MVVLVSIDKALEELYNERHRDFHKIASRLIGGDMYGAQDVVQEALARALAYQSGFNEDMGSLAKWFNIILFRAAIEFKKDERLGGMSTEIKEGDYIVDADFGGDNKLLEEVTREVENLRGANKQICYLYFIRQYKPREITQVTGICGNSVRTAVKRFLQYIRGKYTC